ncbi:uncharacterized protein [Amphiura filiformis]|uniref:uncharacterized protein n=2 Tax=Amphiura filiformis TaxID=82378 RepID=UPI003B225BD6
MADTYEAKFDYEKERDDVLSFHKGELFEIVNKTNDKWWVAKRVSDGTIGYVPSVYLQLSNQRVIGKLIPEKRRNTREHDIHLQALAELHRKVKPLPGQRNFSRSTSCPAAPPILRVPVYPSSYLMWQNRVKAHVIGAALGIPIPSSDEDEEEDSNIPAHQRKTAPAAVPTFLKVFNPAEIQPQRKSYSGRGSMTPEPPSPTTIQPPPMHARSKSWRGETTSTPLPPSSSSSQTFLRSPSAEYKAPPGVFKKPPPVAAPKKPPVSPRISPMSTFEFKPPPKIINTAPVINNNTSNGTCIIINFAPPEPDYDQEDDDDDEIPYHHRLNSSGRISSLSSDESNDLPSPAGPNQHKSPLDLQHPYQDEEKLIHPKPLPNPVKSSRNHQQLHRDLKMSIKTHGVGKVPIDSKPELEKRFQERKRAEKKKEMDKVKEERRTSMEVKLMERLKMEEEKSKEKDASLQEVKERPEFMKVRLKQTPSKT